MKLNEGIRQEQTAFGFKINQKGNNPASETTQSTSISSEDSVQVNNQPGEESVTIMDKVKDFAHKVVDYTEPRPDTGADTVAASSKGAFISGAITGFVATKSPIGSLAGGIGGYAGIKEGQHSKSLTKAIAAGFGAGAAATAIAAIGISELAAITTGAALVINPVGLGVMAVITGLAGVSGTMQGSCLGDVKDSGSAGMITGSLMSTMGGSPLLSISGSLAGAAGGIVDDEVAKDIKGKIGDKFENTAGKIIGEENAEKIRNKVGEMVSSNKVKVLVAAGTGAALGAASGALIGPAFIIVNAALGATVGALSSQVGPVYGQVQRNASSDMQKGLGKILKGKFKNLNKTERIALGAVGGMVSSLTLGLMCSAIGGPILGAAVVVGSGALMGKNVKKALDFQDNYEKPLAKLLEAEVGKEQIKNIPPENIKMLAFRFANKYPKKEDFAAVNQEQFKADLQIFHQEDLKAIKAFQEQMAKEQPGEAAQKPQQ